MGHQPLAQQSKASAKSLKTPLVNAIRTRDIRTLEFLLRFRLDLNVTDTNGMTPVMHAIAALNYAAVLRLYQAGANLLARGPGLVTTMRQAADAKPQTDYEAGQQEKILALLAHEREAITKTLDWKIPISVNQALLGQPADRLPAGPDALFKVTRVRARRCAHALLAAGVDPNARDANGMTAAHYAAGAGHKSLLRDLVKYDADFSLTDDLGYDVADHADQLSGRLGRWVARQVDAAKCAAAQ